jgi:GTP-binding protein HflX
MSRREALPTSRPRERVLSCGVLFGDQAAAQSATPLEELRGLLLAAGADPVGEGIVQRRERAVAGTLMGSGKVDEVRREIERLRPDAVAVDNDLSPAQIRNLEKAWGVRVLDRSEVILDIFASRARTRQARLQVELAQAEYLLPRLRRMWTHLERTEGAIGTRGPGETQLETDRRLLRTRVRDLRRELAQIEARRQREVRSRSDQFTVGLVGYTNAGKSTLLNRLTGAKELAADMLFSTLDTRTRQWRLPDGRTVLLSDTVGFLQRLPHHLVASFHATLEETLHADLLLHVIDASHPECEQQIAAVNEVLHGLSWSTRADVLVFNKIDRVQEPLRLHTLALDRRQDVVFVSAATGEGLERLTAVVAARLDACSTLVDVIVPLADGKSLSAVRRVGALLEQEIVDTEIVRMRLRISEGALGGLRRAVSDAVRFERVAGSTNAHAGGTGLDADRALRH